MAFRRTKAIWRVRGEPITLGVRTLLTGRIELARGEGAARPDPDAVLERAKELEASGADIVEVNPGGAAPLTSLPTSDEELSRMVRVLRKLGTRLIVPISVVTVHSETARRAIELGASIVHDFSGLAFDRELATVANETNVALILGHMRGTPAQWSRLAPLTRLADMVRMDLRASLLRAHQAGIEPRRIVLDPGLEQGKRGHENFNLLRALHNLAPPGQGIQVTLAGKRFLVESVRAGAGERAAALSVAATLALEAGAHLLTVEHPESLRDAVAVVDRIYQADEAAETLT